MSCVRLYGGNSYLFEKKVPEENKQAVVVYYEVGSENNDRTNRIINEFMM